MNAKSGYTKKALIHLPNGYLAVICVCGASVPIRSPEGGRCATCGTLYAPSGWILDSTHPRSA